MDKNTPWRRVQKEFFPKGIRPAAFAKKHGLNEREVRMIIGNQTLIFPPHFSAALSKETGQTPAYFQSLSDRYAR